MHYVRTLHGTTGSGDLAGVDTVVLSMYRQLYHGCYDSVDRQSFRFVRLVCAALVTMNSYVTRPRIHPHIAALAL